MLLKAHPTPPKREGRAAGEEDTQHQPLAYTYAQYTHMHSDIWAHTNHILILGLNLGFGF